MNLDVYKSCTHAEKRQVLEAFWHADAAAPVRINYAALQYGPFAIALLIIVAAELAPVIYFSLSRGYAVAWIPVLIEAAVVASAGWAVARLRTLRHQFAS